MLQNGPETTFLNPDPQPKMEFSYSTGDLYSEHCKRVDDSGTASALTILESLAIQTFAEPKHKKAKGARLTSRNVGLRPGLEV